MSTNDSTTRICSDCNQEFPLDQEHFRRYLDKSGKFYFQRICIHCRRTVEREREKRKGTAPERSRKYRQSHPDQVKAGKKDWEARNPDKVQAQKKRSHLRCKEKNNQRSMNWHYANLDYVRAQRSNHYQEHRDEIIARVIQYQRDNPEQFRSVQHRRRAREIGAEGSFTGQDIINLYNEQNGRCGYCGITLYDEFDIEHMNPIARGGSNWPENLILACSPCNASKHAKTHDEWKAVRGW